MNTANGVHEEKDISERRPGESEIGGSEKSQRSRLSSR